MQSSGVEPNQDQLCQPKAANKLRPPLGKAPSHHHFFTCLTFDHHCHLTLSFDFIIWLYLHHFITASLYLHHFICITLSASLYLHHCITWSIQTRCVWSGPCKSRADSTYWLASLSPSHFASQQQILTGNSFLFVNQFYLGQFYFFLVCAFHLHQSQQNPKAHCICICRRHFN